MSGVNISLFGIYALSVSIIGIGAWLKNNSSGGEILISVGVLFAVIGIIADIISKYNYYQLRAHEVNYR